MVDEDVLGSFTEWQKIPSPSSATGKDQFNTNDDIVENREDLPINNQESLSSAAAAADEITAKDRLNNNHDNDGIHEKDERNNQWLKKHLRELTSRIFQVASKVKNYAVCKLRIGTFTSTTTSTRILAVLLVSLLYVMTQRRRMHRQIDNSKKLMLLINEKDQKIDQLLLQIRQMNDSLLASRKVPVVRVR